MIKASNRREINRACLHLSTSQIRKNTLATRKEESFEYQPSKITATSVTLKARDWRAPVKSVYCATGYVLELCGKQHEDDIDLNTVIHLSFKVGN